MFVSLSLVDRLSGVMDPEELPQLGFLIDWAEDHGYYPGELITPVVGEAAGWVYWAYQALDEGLTGQAHAAGLTPEARERIIDAMIAAPAEAGVCARWDGAAAAAREAGLPFSPWAAVADIAMLLDWASSRDLLCHVVLHGTGEARRAARAVMMLRDGAGLLDVWQEV